MKGWNTVKKVLLSPLLLCLLLPLSLGCSGSDSTETDQTNAPDLPTAASSNEHVPSPPLPASQEPPAASPEPPAPSPETDTDTTQPPAPAILSSPLKATLNPRTGSPVTLYLYAENETVSTVTSPSCHGASGDTMRTGHYVFYVELAGELTRSTISPSPVGEWLEFNDSRPGQFEALPRTGERQDDLLLLRQRMSCNTEQLTVYTLTPDGSALRAVPFVSESGSSDALMISTLDILPPDLFAGILYDNSTGRTIHTRWRYDSEQQVLLWVSETASGTADQHTP